MLINFLASCNQALIGYCGGQARDSRRKPCALLLTCRHHDAPSRPLQRVQAIAQKTPMHGHQNS